MSRRSGGYGWTGGVAKDADPSVRGCRDNPDRRAADEYRAARGFSGLSTTAREARRLAAVARWFLTPPCPPFCEFGF
jgi:hypothetical protein